VPRMNAKLQELLESIVVYRTPRGGIGVAVRFPGDEEVPDTGYENPGNATPRLLDFSDKPDHTPGVKFVAELGRAQVVGRKIVPVDGADDPDQSLVK
jgi:hypothetical protein